MTTLVVWALVATVLSLMWYLAVAWADWKPGNSLQQYFFYDWSLADRDVRATFFASGMSLATVVLALLQLGRLFGLALSWATLTYCLGWLLLVVTARRIRQLTTKNDTLHSFLGRSYGSRKLAKVASAATVAGFVGTFATELLAASVITEALGLSPIVGSISIIVMALTTITYSAAGGFRTVIRSDRVQALLIVPALIGLGIFALHLWKEGASGTSVPHFTVGALPLSLAVSLFLINVPFPLVDMSAWQRVRAASSLGAVRRGGVASIVGFAVAWTCLIFIGSTMGSEDPTVEAFELLAQGAAEDSPVLAGVGAILVFPGLVAAMLSTADTFLNAASHTFSLDLLEVKLTSRDSSSSAHIRRHVVTLGVVGFALAFGLREIGFGIVDMVFAVYGGTLALFVPVTVILLGLPLAKSKKLKTSAVVAIVGGFAAAWLNGLYSVGCGQSVSGICTGLEAVFPHDVYRSPLYAFFGSAGLYFLVGLPGMFKSTKRAQ